MDAKLVESLAAAATPITVAAGGTGDVQVTVKYTWIQVGFYAHVATQPSVLRVKLEWAAGGEPTDVVELETQLAASMTRASNSKRLLWCAEEAGKVAARFLKEKQTVAEAAK